MSRFKRFSHVMWCCCEYQIVYRYKILQGSVKSELIKTIHAYSGRVGCEVVELNVQKDNVDLLLKVSSKRSISEMMGYLKGKTAEMDKIKFPLTNFKSAVLERMNLLL